MKYRTKSITIEAIQFTGDMPAVDKWLDELHVPEDKKEEVVDTGTGDLYITCRCVSTRVYPGDWIILHGDGIFDVLRNPVFAAIYEPVPDTRGEMKVDFNNVRKKALSAYGSLVEKLRGYMDDNGQIKMDPIVIEDAMEDLRNALVVIALTHEPGDPDFADVLGDKTLPSICDEEE